jgi:hypothetical protein
VAAAAAAPWRRWRVEASRPGGYVGVRRSAHLADCAQDGSTGLLPDGCVVTAREWRPDQVIYC